MTSLPRNLPRILLVAEAAISVAFGAVATAFLKEPILEWGAWYVGGIVTLSTVLVYLKIEQSMESQFADISQSLRILDISAQISDPDFSRFRDQDFKELSKKLEGYRDGVAIIRDDSYYDWLKRRLASHPASVHAISMRPEAVYKEDVREEGFLAENVAAAMAGTKIERIFISRKENLVYKKNRDPIRKHVQTPNMSAVVCWGENLSQELRHEMSGGGLSIYDNQTVFLDQSYIAQGFSERLGIDRGELTPQAIIYRPPSPKVEEYRSVFESVMSCASEASRNEPKLGYIRVLRELDDWLGEKYGHFRTFVQKRELTNEESKIKTEWLSLREEIRLLTTT